MSTHINASEGAIAETVLLPGDPLRARFIAENFLDNAKCYNEVRGMYGFTGTYHGKRVSVQGTGMGQPSLSIYVNELFQFYNVQKAIRIGTCGSIQKSLNVRDTVLVNAACSDSSLVLQRFGSLHFAPAADFGLLESAYQNAKKLG
ncbi:MAG: purine-nucleoside phosphorylase, partial [Treponema sp.]